VDAIREVALKLADTPFLRLTKVGVLRAVRRRRLRGDGMNQKTRVRAVHDLARQIMRTRARRFFARYVRPAPTLPQRLLAWRERRAKATAREREGPIQFWFVAWNARSRKARGRRDEHYLDVEVVQDVAEVGASGDAYAITRRRIATEHRYRIPPDWLARVHEPGLALHDKKLTLWAERQDDVIRKGHRVEIFAAIWARQGRSYSLVTERGFIARVGSHICHAEEAATAVRGVVRSIQRACQEQIGPEGSRATGG
jgi:hypothetical protein